MTHSHFIEGKKHNVRIWGSQIRHLVREQIRDRPKVNVCCCIAYDRVICPFYEQSINANVHFEMLENHVYPQLEEFQARDAPQHWSLSESHRMQPSQSTGLVAADLLGWPQRSPDITPSDFFVCGM